MEHAKGFRIRIITQSMNSYRAILVSRLRLAQKVEKYASTETHLNEIHLQWYIAYVGSPNFDSSHNPAVQTRAEMV